MKNCFCTHYSDTPTALQRWGLWPCLLAVSTMLLAWPEIAIGQGGTRPPTAAWEQAHAAQPASASRATYPSGYGADYRTLDQQQPMAAAPQRSTDGAMPYRYPDTGELPVAGRVPVARITGLLVSSSPLPQPHAVVGKPSVPEEIDAPWSEHPVVTSEAFPGIPAGFQPWWADRIARPHRVPQQSQPVTVEMLIVAALQNSPQILAMSRKPLIQETRIVEAESEFDLRVFMDSAFDRVSDPVGNELQTGGPPRFREENWDYSAGVRRKMSAGGTLEASQRIGYQHNNSEFFVPREQGNSRLVLSYTQPLLRGAGKAFNAAPTVVAEIETATAWDRFSARLQDYLLSVTGAHWKCYLERAAYLQKQRLYEQAQSILSELEDRRSIDSAPSQIIRTRAAVATRHSELARAERNVLNAEARIRALVGDAQLFGGSQVEFVPQDRPSPEQVGVDLPTVRRTALRYRPEMNEAIKKVRTAALRVDVSKQELLPVLDLVLETYVAGLEGRGDIGSSLGNQFGVGEPGYTIGLKFEVPLGRRGASARFQRRQLELQEMSSELEATAVQLMTEIDVVAGEVETSYREMLGKYQAMIATEEDVAYLTVRWRRLAGEDRSAALILEDLLDAQVRLAVEQYNFCHAQVGYTMALVELKRATGTLLQHENISLQRGMRAGVPDVRPVRAVPTGPTQAVPAEDPETILDRGSL